MYRKYFSILFIIFFCSCNMTSKYYNDSHYSVYNTIGKEYIQYIKNDCSLNESDENIKLGIVDVWEQKLNSEKVGYTELVGIHNFVNMYIINDYIQYVKSDDSLDDISKDIRISTARDWLNSYRKFKR